VRGGVMAQPSAPEDQRSATDRPLATTASAPRTQFFAPSSGHSIETIDEPLPFPVPLPPSATGGMGSTASTELSATAATMNSVAGSESARSSDVGMIGTTSGGSMGGVQRAQRPGRPRRMSDGDVERLVDQIFPIITYRLRSELRRERDSSGSLTGLY
jgi:hypothetical protein